MKLKPAALRGKTVLVRVDYNVPLKGGKVADDFRIRVSLPLIRHLRKCGAKTILITHLEIDGRTPSLSPIVAHLKKLGVKDLKFISGKIGAGTAKKVRESKNSVILLDNLRLDPREEKNTKDYAKFLAVCGDIFVNDAFSASHRAHASIAGVPKFLPSYAGPLFAREIAALGRILRPPHPALAILGGNKISTKMPVIKSLLRRADRIFIGGAMANVFLKFSGNEIGRSFVEKGSKRLVHTLSKNKKIILPVDVIVESGERRLVKRITEIGVKDRVCDLGPRTADLLRLEARRAKIIVWNGPLGWIEAGCVQGSLRMAKILTAVRGEAIVGGGDTVALLDRSGLAKKFSLVSTGGGAMLEYIAKGTLPGLRALK